MSVQTSPLHLLAKEAGLLLVTDNVSALLLDWPSAMSVNCEDSIHTPPQVHEFICNNLSARICAEEAEYSLLFDQEEKEQKPADSNSEDTDADSAQAGGPGDRGQEDDQGPKPKKIE